MLAQEAFENEGLEDPELDKLGDDKEDVDSEDESD